jgi:hypothetical protein
VAEYSALKQEIGQRSTAQLGLVSVNITVAGAVGGFSIVGQDQDRVLFALLLSYACPILGLLWIDNARAISAIGTYFTDVTWPIFRRVCLVTKAGLPSWEDAVRSDERGHRRRRLWLASPVPLAFTGPSVWALVRTFEFIKGDPYIIALWVIGLLVTIRSGTAIFAAIANPGRRITRAPKPDFALPVVAKVRFED